MSEQIKQSESFIAKIGGLKWHIAARLWFFFWVGFGLFIIRFLPLLERVFSLNRGVLLFVLVTLWIGGGLLGWRGLHSIPKCPNCKKPISWLWANSEYDLKETNPSKVIRCPSCDWDPNG